MKPILLILLSCSTLFDQERLADFRYIASEKTEQQPAMYGLIGKIKATPGSRDALMNILLEGTRDMPGCLSYIIAADANDPDALWITEVWDSAESHKASLSLPPVQDAIAKGRPLIAGFGERFETVPVGDTAFRMGP